jgi:hypothetical protein
MRQAILALWLFASLLAPRPIRPGNQEKEKNMSVKEVTVVLMVESVEPCVKFWVDE